MIDPALFLRCVIDPGCRLAAAGLLEPAIPTHTDEARVLLLAIALQESGLEHRRQVDSAGNPIATLARGWWQFEAGGGVAGVMTHPSSATAAEWVCQRGFIPFEQADVHEALAWNGPLAAAYARLLLWTDPEPLPAIGDASEAWEAYLALWRPGKPHPETWLANYTMALETVLNPKESSDAAA